MKEIIASNVEKLAEVLIEYGVDGGKFHICRIDSASGPSYTDKYYEIPEDIAKYAILVVSNNNTAVENITLDLPKADSMIKDNTWTELFDRTEHKEIYFSSVADNLLGEENVAWGLISARMGKKSYISDTLKVCVFAKKNDKSDKVTLDMVKDDSVSWDEAVTNFNHAKRKVLFIRKDIEKDKHNQSDLWCSLRYPLEYIIAGQKSDKENISQIILKLSILREGVNIAHIIADSDKRNQAQALAISLMGFTGNAAIIKAAQFLIMGVWAYGESMIDIRRLFDGEELNLLKTKEDWKLSLQSLLSFNFELSKQNNNADKTTSIKRWSEGKLNYKDYLTILLMTMDKTLKLFRTMSVMELRIIALGDVDFRMNRYVYQATGTIGVQYGEKQLCERSEQYGYI